MGKIRNSKEGRLSSRSTNKNPKKNTTKLFIIHMPICTCMRVGYSMCVLFNCKLNQ